MAVETKWLNLSLDLGLGLGLGLNQHPAAPEPLSNLTVLASVGRLTSKPRKICVKVSQPPNQKQNMPCYGSTRRQGNEAARERNGEVEEEGTWWNVVVRSGGEAAGVNV